ncbi:MAG TPA: hypothetical protein VH482_21255 [Thermomicrobiales bacterium]|jgi:hypothetical protein
MEPSMPPVKERPADIPAVVGDLVALLTNDLRAITALTSYERDATDAADPVASRLFAQIERRLRDEAGQLQELLEARREADEVSPDFVMPTGDGEVDD